MKYAKRILICELIIIISHLISDSYMSGLIAGCLWSFYLYIIENKEDK